jgi:nucleoid-associated protein YgaU
MKLLRYGILATITAPIWIPVAFAIRVAAPTTYWAFRKPAQAIAIGAGAGLLWYAVSTGSCTKTKDEIRVMYKQYQDKTSLETKLAQEEEVRRTLEEKLQRKNQEYQTAVEQAKQYAQTAAKLSEKVQYVEVAVQQSKQEIERLSAADKVKAQEHEKLLEKIAYEERKAKDAQNMLEQKTRDTQSTEQKIQFQQREAPMQRAEYRTSEQYLEDPKYYFYYVKLGDTASNIARTTTGDENTYPTIMRDNSIAVPEKMITGQMLRIRREFSKSRVKGLYIRVPTLRSETLDAQVSISAFCKGNNTCIDRVLLVNRQLGLDYNNTFPLRRGERIVYYE